ncbi:tetratricopeptide repeat protein [Frigoriglobus tundricola]|uniref:Uncharacterized protein n=1 Tax=Frigoriglobus tundricola TaxID=2774151 RepID=A0A6M5YYJ9_9BACT|nr:tetratricopeptide repeat protein [Frigoriglobus tundricola]QJW98293.1 hypothetical protein FTUN_5881 [Frigoriglobus tundricola]
MMRTVPPSVAVGLLLVLLTTLAYSPALKCGFVNWDDQKYVYENSHVTGGLSSEAFGWAFSTFHASNWHPLTWLSLQADATVFGPGAAGFHLTNLVLHATNVLLFYAFLLRTTASLWPAAVAAALFAVHPIHVESVAWVSERKDVLSATFWLLGLLLYARYVARPGPGRYAALVLVFAMGLLVKPMLVTFPCALLLMDYWPLRRAETFSRLFREKVPLFVLAGLASAVTVAAQRAGGATAGLGALPLGDRAGNAVVAYAIYLRKLFWPNDLAAYYPHPGSRPAGDVLLCGALLVGISYTCWRLRARVPQVAVGWAWFLGTLVPVIGIVQVGRQALADRYAYIPFLGLYVALTWAARRGVMGAATGRGATRIGTLVAVGTVAAGLLVTRSQIEHWRNGVALWERVLAVVGSDFHAHYNLATALRGEGRSDDALHHIRAALRMEPSEPQYYNEFGVLLMDRNEFPEAEARFRQALERDPNFALARMNLGTVLVKQRRWEEAAAELERALRVSADLPMAHLNYGAVLEQRGDTAAAERAYRRAIELEPDSAAAHYNLGTLLGKIGRRDGAVRALAEAVRLNPQFANAHLNLGRAYEDVGDDARAVECFRAAARLEPSKSPHRLALAAVLARSGRAEEALTEEREALRLEPRWPARYARNAWVLATHPDPAQRDERAAVALAEQACRVTERRQPALLEVLAAAYAAAGRYADAAAVSSVAIEQARATRLDPLAQRIEKQRALYLTNQPFRDTSLR